ncbi:MAG TPA: hypothetical protein VI731_08475 [Bacteroidia bacterium]|nr:hypothetical protein [Bacteroidia bacterium]
MEIRFKPLELVIVFLGLLATGTIIGMAIGGALTAQSSLLYAGLTLIPMISIVLRKRVRLTQN